MLNNYCIVRDHKAGVFAGTLTWINENDRKNIKLKNVRKIYYWKGAACVEQIATEGVSKPAGCKITVETLEQELFDAVQVLLATDAAKENLAKVKPWRA